MPQPGPEALRLGQAYRLALQSAPRHGLAGERLGRGTGASLEFQDRRIYAVGDDLRHLDWRAFARSDQLMVRQYREVVQPRVEILLDVSRSVAIDDAKVRTAVDLVSVLATAARADGLQAVIVLAGDDPRILEFDRFVREGAEFDGRSPWSASLPASLALLRAGSMRVLVSDFLFPHEASQLVRPLRAGIGGFALVQVLSHGDREPPREEALRLVDAETDGALDLVIDQRCRERYLGRLTRLSLGLEEECRRGGGYFVAVDAEWGVDRVCRERLVPGGVLAPN